MNSINLDLTTTISSISSNRSNHNQLSNKCYTKSNNNLKSAEVSYYNCKINSSDSATFDQQSLCTDYLPNNLLASYPMQWGLNRDLIIVNTHQVIRVNAYKLGSQSLPFREFIKHQQQQQQSGVNKTIGDEATCHSSGFQQPPLYIRCDGLVALADLAFALHWCHLGQCQIYTKLPRPPPAALQTTALMHTHELIIYQNQVVCNLTSALRVAQLYQIDELRRRCHAHLRDNCGPDTCWQLWCATLVSGNTNSDTALNDDDTEDDRHWYIDNEASRIVQNYLLANFTQLLNAKGKASNGLLRLTERQLETILASDRLNVSSEMDVVRAIQLWASHQPHIVSDLVIPRLLSSCIRFNQLSLAEVDSIYNLPAIRRRRAGLTTCKPLANTSLDSQANTTTTNTNQTTLIDVNMSLEETRQVEENHSDILTTTSSGNNSTLTELPKQTALDRQVNERLANRSACLVALRQARRRLFRRTRNLRPLIGSGNESRLQVDPSSSGQTMLHLLIPQPETPALTAVAPSQTSENPAAQQVYSSNTEANLEASMDARLPHEAIFVFGGWEDGQPCSSTRVLDVRRGIWLSFEQTTQNSQIDQSAADATKNLDRPSAGDEEIVSPAYSHHNNQRNVNCLGLPHPLMSFGVAIVHNQYIYIVGGETTNNQATQQLLHFDLDAFQSNRLNTPSTGQCGWRVGPSMHESRRDLVLVNLDDRFLYALGGDNNRTVLGSVERLCLTSEGTVAGSWLEMASMLLARGAPAADALAGSIYVCGGYTESRMEALTNSCEIYSQATNQWTLIQPMAQTRYYAQALAINGCLFVLGGGGEIGSGIGGIGGVNLANWYLDTAGRNRERASGLGRNARLNPATAIHGYSSTVERYQPETGAWELMPAMSERADFAACVFEGKIVCLGGGGEAFCTNEVECWTPWTQESPPAGTDSHPELPNWLAAQWEAPLEETGFENTTTTTTTTTSSESNNRNLRSGGWQSGLGLPRPIWGHRCVVVHGVDRIKSYLQRTNSQSHAESPECVHNSHKNASQSSSSTAFSVQPKPERRPSKTQIVARIQHEQTTDGTHLLVVPDLYKGWDAFPGKWQQPDDADVNAGIDNALEATLNSGMQARVLLERIDADKSLAVESGVVELSDDYSSEPSSCSLSNLDMDF